MGRLRTEVVSLGAAALLMVAATSPGHDGEAGGDDAVAVVWIDVADRVPFAADAVRREIESVLAPLGVRTRFRSARPGSDLAEGEIPVVLLASDPPGALRVRQVMGAVHAVRPATRAAWVYLPQVMRALGRGPDQVPAILDVRGAFELGRALGRVVAHELVHLLAPGAPHAHRGLMAAQLDREVLLGERPVVDGVTRSVVSAAGPVV